MEIREIRRGQLRVILAGDELRKGKMLKLTWPRLRDKRKRNPETGLMETLEAAGTPITRRLVLRRDWKQPTPSGNFVPKDGIMFNAKTQEEAKKIREEHDLFLFFSLEGNTHPHRENDHPVNVPLDRVTIIEDTRDKVVYRVKEE